MSHKITIIIPTYNRHANLLQALTYWSVYPVKLIVVDGSNISDFDVEKISSYINIDYYYIPDSIESRLFFASTKITTTYAAIISDDEFLSYSALLSATAILDSEPDVVAVLGATLGFYGLEDKLVGRHHYRSVHQLDISAKNPAGRIRQRLAFPENSIFYPLVRSEVLKLACQFIGEYRYSCPYVPEWQMEVMLCAAGAVRVMPQLMWFRNLEKNIISNQNWNREIYFSYWCRDPANADELDRLKNSANKYFSLASSALPIITGTEFIDLYAVVEQKLLANQKEQLSVLRKCYALLPITFRKFVRSQIGFLMDVKPSGLLPVAEILDYFTSIDIEFDLNEISRIEKILKNRCGS
jgi:glycosyltransferase domain-containing protein